MSFLDRSSFMIIRKDFDQQDPTEKPPELLFISYMDIIHIHIRSSSTEMQEININIAKIHYIK